MPLSVYLVTAPGLHYRWMLDQAADQEIPTETQHIIAMSARVHGIRHQGGVDPPIRPEKVIATVQELDVLVPAGQGSQVIIDNVDGLGKQVGGGVDVWSFASHRQQSLQYNKRLRQGSADSVHSAQRVQRDARNRGQNVLLDLVFAGSLPTGRLEIIGTHVKDHHFGWVASVGKGQLPVCQPPLHLSGFVPGNTQCHGIEGISKGPVKYLSAVVESTSRLPACMQGLEFDVHRFMAFCAAQSPEPFYLIMSSNNGDTRQDPIFIIPMIGSSPPLDDAIAVEYDIVALRKGGVVFTH